MANRRTILLALIILVVCSVAQAATSLTYVDLVKRLTDLEALSVLPVPGETCAQWSSYDRASAYDAQSGKYLKWDANGDGRGIIRTEGNMQVLAEIEGPGCIFRTWSAAPKEGRVIIYLDGAERPAVDLRFKDYFSRKARPFNYPSLVNYMSSGANCYVPMPFQKSCKIIAEKSWGDYFHFTYTTYPKDTIVPTFRRDLTTEEVVALADADKMLTSGLGSDPAGAREGEATRSARLSVAPGQTATVAKLRGPAAITAIKVKLDPAWAKTAWTGLRQVVLRISWDGEKEPSVWCPLGDFFGTAPGANLYKSLPLGITKDGAYCYWYMPFAKSAVVELVNEGSTACPIEFTLTQAPLAKPVAELGRFHAKFHRDAFLPTEPERWIDWPMLKTTGKGRFCGVMLHVYNPKGGWWGEGDEKFWVDGEKFPSTIGTGSEDYFGYAWCNPGLFQNAFHNQTYNQRGNAGSISVNRWHIADNVPFQTSFAADIEKYYPNGKPTLYALVAYWYQAAGQADPYTPVAVADRIGYYEFVPWFATGAMEGERLAVIACSAGETSTQDLGADEGQWSGGSHLWWSGAQPGAKLDLAVRIAKAGTFDVKTRMTKARDYGIVQFYMNDQKLGEPLDLYAKDLSLTGEMPLGTLNLPAGKHKLTIEIVGANEKADKAYMAGLDYIKLERK